jgi:hypothetical protein
MDPTITSSAGPGAGFDATYDVVNALTVGCKRCVAYSIRKYILLHL